MDVRPGLLSKCPDPGSRIILNEVANLITHWVLNNCLLVIPCRVLPLRCQNSKNLASEFPMQNLAESSVSINFMTTATLLTISGSGLSKGL